MELLHRNPLHADILNQCALFFSFARFCTVGRSAKWWHSLVRCAGADTKFVL